MPVRNGLLLCEFRRSNCLPESIATGPALLRAVAFATLSRCARRNPPSAVLILFYSGEKKPVFADRFLKYGRRERIRTSDPLVPNQLRYQAALLADGGACYCSPQEASTAFCALPPNRLESRRPVSFMLCHEKLPYRYSAFDAVPAGA